MAPSPLLPTTRGLHASVRILREVLGWRDLQPSSGWQHGDAQFPITHRAFDGAVPLIVRGIAADQLDKGSSQFGQEGRRRSPHSCLQECLNADDNANWGLLLTGDRLRLLHDNPSLVKPAYLAVDLELFDEFAVLWLLLHASRFRHPQTGSCAMACSRPSKPLAMACCSTPTTTRCAANRPMAA